MRYTTRPLMPEARARLVGVRREHSQFSASWSDTLILLERELVHLGVRYKWVLQIDCTETDLRLDGELRANARIASPSVAIAIDSKSKGSLLFTCGRFTTWKDNVRAIALGLEALRKVERYGIVQSDEQYRGWQALPPGTPVPTAKMTIDDALEVLRLAAGWISGPDYDDPDAIRQAYRHGARHLHPDAGGDPEQFRRLVEARDLALGAAA